MSEARGFQMVKVFDPALSPWIKLMALEVIRGNDLDKRDPKLARVSAYGGTGWVKPNSENVAPPDMNVGRLPYRYLRLHDGSSEITAYIVEETGESNDETRVDDTCKDKTTLGNVVPSAGALVQFDNWRVMTDAPFSIGISGQVELLQERKLCLVDINDNIDIQATRRQKEKSDQTGAVLQEDVVLDPYFYMGNWTQTECIPKAPVQEKKQKDPVNSARIDEVPRSHYLPENSGGSNGDSPDQRSQDNLGCSANGDSQVHQGSEDRCNRGGIKRNCLDNTKMAAPPKKQAQPRRSWEASFQALSNFKSFHGHCDVPTAYEDRELAGFASFLRADMMCITTEQRQRLIDLGMNFRSSRRSSSTAGDVQGVESPENSKTFKDVHPGLI